MRKMTLRAYVEMLRCEDRLREHPHYFEAAVLAVRVYLDLHDAPVGSKEREEQEARSAGMTPAERKKMLSKQKKADAKNAATGGGASASKKGKNKKKGKGSAVTAAGGAAAANAAEAEKKADAKGEALAKTETPLVEASKFLAPLIELAPNRLTTQVLAFEVAWRKQKVLQMLRALRRAHAIAPEDPATLRMSAIFLHFFDTTSASFDANVKTVAQSESETVLGAGATASSMLDKV